MMPLVKVLHVCQTGASGLVYHGHFETASWFAWGRRPHTVRMVPHGYLSTANRGAYETAIRAELDRLGTVVGAFADPLD